MNEKPATCLGCPYFDRPMVRGEGHPSASLFILGQSPGDREREEKRPFVGPSGEVLNTALRKAGISRSQNYVSNVVKCYVPAGEKIHPEAVKHCRPLLSREMDLLSNCKTILTVGKEAFDGVTGKDMKLVHVRKSHEEDPNVWLRGAPFVLGDKIVIGTAHPSHVMRTGFMNAPTFEHDVERAGKFAEGELKIVEPSFIQNPSDQEVTEYVSSILDKGKGGIDIETPRYMSLDEDEADAVIDIPVTQIGLSANLYESIIIHPDQFHLLDPLLGGEREVILWAYGAGFDFQHLGKKWSLGNVKIADAMIAFYLLWSDLAKNPTEKNKKKGGGAFDLATAQTYYSTVPYYKNWAKLKPELYDTLGNCYDTYTAMEIGEACLTEMRKKKQNMEPLFWSLMPVIKAIEPWRTIGCKYDTQKSMTLLVTLSKTLEAYEKFWREKLPLVDWGSPKQLVTLFTAMGLNVPKKKRPNGKFTPCVDDDTLENFKNKGVQLAGLIQEMKMLRHSGDFVDLADKDGRVRTRAKLHGQAGGRIQLVDKALQTVPEKLGGTYPRSQFIPDCSEDLILVSDFSQAEFFLYGWYCQDPLIEEIRLSGDYVYGWFHEQIFNEPFFQEGKPRKKRYRGKVDPAKLLVTKSYPLGFTYGRRAVESKYKWLLEWYHKKFTRVAPFHSDLIFRATRDGYLQTVFGRMRRFPNPRGQHNQILAFPGQSTLADVLVRNAIVPLKDSLPRMFGPRSRVLFTVHDSVVCNIQGAAQSFKTAETAVELVTSTLSAPIPEMGGLSIPCETKIGLNWNDVHFIDELEQYVPYDTRAISAV